MRPQDRDWQRDLIAVNVTPSSILKPMPAVMYLLTTCLKIPPLVLQFVKGDLQSADLLNHILSHENIDTVMHFAAQARTGSLGIL